MWILSFIRVCVNFKHGSLPSKLEAYFTGNLMREPVRHIPRGSTCFLLKKRTNQTCLLRYLQQHGFGNINQKLKLVQYILLKISLLQNDGCCKIEVKPSRSAAKFLIFQDEELSPSCLLAFIAPSADKKLRSHITHKTVSPGLVVVNVNYYAAFVLLSTPTFRRDDTSQTIFCCYEVFNYCIDNYFSSILSALPFQAAFSFLSARFASVFLTLNTVSLERGFSYQHSVMIFMNTTIVGFSVQQLGKQGRASSTQTTFRISSMDGLGPTTSSKGSRIGSAAEMAEVEVGRDTLESRGRRRKSDMIENTFPRKIEGT